MAAKKQTDDKTANVRPLERHRMVEPGFARNNWIITLPIGVPYEQVFDPAFWKMLVPRISRGDEISVRRDDLTLRAELVVVSVDKTRMTCEARELWKAEVKAATTQESERGGYSVHDLGVVDGFAIRRDEDGAIMARGIATYDQAMARIRTEFVPPSDTDHHPQVHY